MKIENKIEINTERLVLKPFTLNELEHLYKLNSDPEVMHYISPPLSKEDVSNVINWFISEWKRLKFGWFAIFLKKSLEFIGQCGLQCLEGNPEEKEIEIAFVISKDHWNMGYASEAAQAVLNFGLKEHDLKKIVAITEINNNPSQRVLDKLKFNFIETRELYQRKVKYYLKVLK